MKKKLISIYAAILSLGTTFSGWAAQTPSITLQKTAGKLEIHFSGTLQSALSITGPWTVITNSNSPYRPDAGTSAAFYRAFEIESIFAHDTVVNFSLRGPFQTYFEKAFAGMPDGIFPPVREKPYFDGSVKIAGQVLPSSMRVRGNSSLQECPFPKLKFKISKTDRPGTPFADAREIKIGTHCAEGGHGSIGRLRDESAAYREVLAYETMHTLGFVTPRVRRARIDYHDTTPENGNSEVGWQVTRNAMVLEDAEVLAERMGGKALNDEEIEALTKAGFDPVLITEFLLFHAMLGNWDYGLSLDGSEMWNTDVIELPGGTYIPVPGDFDLASWVTEFTRPNSPPNYHPELGELERETLFQVEKVKQSNKETFGTAAALFLDKRIAIEATVQTGLVDDRGKTNILKHVAAFYNALDMVGH